MIAAQPLEAKYLQFLTVLGKQLDKEV